VYAVVDKELRLRFQQCEERRLRVLRGDAALGILPIAEIDEMVATYRELGEAGMLEAWMSLAHYHDDPNGLHESLDEAAEAACRALSLGSVEARAYLRHFLPRFAQDIAPPAHAADAARALHAKLESDRDGTVHYLAGLFAFHGFGVTRDVVECARLHAIGAEKGDPDAMFEMYVLLSTGTGVAKDEAAALVWCRRAADENQPRACYNMGAFYATGRGVERDEAEAIRWYERASDFGSGAATATLAYMIHRGDGCVADPARAEELFALAEELGFDTAALRAQL
jgi:TPR repeat protein